jgi:hypothetical protein
LWARGNGCGQAQAGAVPAVSQAIDPLKFAVDGDRQGKGIQAVAQTLQGPELGRIADACGQEPIQGCLRAIIRPMEPRTDPRFADEFHGGLEEIHHQAQLVAVEIIDGGLRLE